LTVYAYECRVIILFNLYSLIFNIIKEIWNDRDSYMDKAETQRDQTYNKFDNEIRNKLSEKNTENLKRMEKELKNKDTLNTGEEMKLRAIRDELRGR